MTAHHTQQSLLDYLKELNIETKTEEHPPLFTVEESKQHTSHIPGGHTKNLFLKDKKGQLWLVVALEDSIINMKTLHPKIGAARLSFGKAELLIETLGVKPGSVTPFSIINDREKKVKVILEADMMEEETLNFHPLQNTATTSISSINLRKFLESCGSDFQVLSLAEKENG